MAGAYNLGFHVTGLGPSRQADLVGGLVLAYPSSLPETCPPTRVGYSVRPMGMQSGDQRDCASLGNVLKTCVNLRLCDQRFKFCPLGQVRCP